MRHSLGTAVFAGMLGVTLFGIGLTPVFFYVVQGLGELPAFSTLGMRRVGFTLTSVLNILLLGLPALLSRLLRRDARERQGTDLSFRAGRRETINQSPAVRKESRP
jgi:hypothetical protein